jgi:hypothetical protein
VEGADTVTGFVFQKATVYQGRLRLGLVGPAGSGKSMTALKVATALGGRVAVVDTERGSASKYANDFDFDVLELTSFAPQTYVAAIHAAEEAGYTVLVLDSLSHAWSGKDGALEMVDRAAKRSQSGNNFGAWRDVTPHHNAMVDAILGSSCHIIATMRAKTEYVQERDERTGKTTVRKIGLAPIQRQDMDFEFDVCGDLDHEHTLIVTKSRCSALTDAIIPLPGAELAETLRTWLGQGVAPIVQPAQPPTETPAPVRVAVPGADQQARALAEVLKPPIDWTEHDRLMPQLAVAAPTAAPEDPGLAGDLAAHFDTQPPLERVVAVRFPPTQAGYDALIHAIREELQFTPADQARALGGCEIKEFIKAQDWQGRAERLDWVWAALRQVADQQRPVGVSAGGAETE